MVLEQIIGIIFLCLAVVALIVLFYFTNKELKIKEAEEKYFRSSIIACINRFNDTLENRLNDKNLNDKNIK